MSSLIDLSSFNNSVAARQIDSTRVIQSLTDNTYDSLCRAQKQGIGMVWHDEILTPQQVCDGLGTHAGKVFQFHSILTDAIVSIATAAGIQPDILTPTNNFTVNSDGTVTVLSTPYGS